MIRVPACNRCSSCVCDSSATVCKLEFYIVNRNTKILCLPGWFLMFEEKWNFPNECHENEWNLVFFLTPVFVMFWLDVCCNDDKKLFAIETMLFKKIQILIIGRFNFSQKFSQFHAVFRKIWRNHMLAPPPRGLALPPAGDPGSAPGVNPLEYLHPHAFIFSIAAAYYHTRLKLTSRGFGDREFVPLGWANHLEGGEPTCEYFSFYIFMFFHKSEIYLGSAVEHACLIDKSG